MDEAGIQIPGLELKEKLGQGGMASVWKARQLSLDRIVAVKILPADASRDSSDLLRFHAEAKSAAKLKHPGIVQVYDVSLEHGLPYIVMEYIAGYTVRDWLKRKGKLAEGEVLQVADCVADALIYAWDKAGIIHCDIKPDNVMVDSDGTVKVADLGLARSVSATAGGSDESHILGTPAYMSPEQALGMSDLDCRSDIYSLGAMLYELLTGRSLFQGNPEEKILEMQVKDTVDDPAVFNPKLSKGTFWLLEKMLAKDRTKRYQSWSEFRADLAKVRKGKLFGPLLGDGESTVRRSRLRAGQGHPVASKVAGGKPERQALPLVLIILAVVILTVVVAAVVLMNGNRRQPSLAGPAEVVALAENAAETAAGRLFDAALAWSRNNPASYDESIEKLKVVAEKGRGTKAALKADAEIARLGRAREAAVQDVLAGLKDRTAGMIDNRDYGAAAAIYEEYDGDLAAETRTVRASIAGQLREDERSVAKESRIEPVEVTPIPPARPKEDDIQARVDRLLDSVAAKILTGGIEAARAEMSSGMTSLDLSSRSVELDPVRELLDGVIAVNQRIIDSFRDQKGQQIKVGLSSGPVDFIVSGVSGDKVHGIYRKTVGGSTASVPLSFGINDLAPSEKVQRMGAGESPSMSLAKGLLAFSSKAYPLARNYFAKTHPLISRRLIALIPGS